jgi:hypothetical protein
MIDGPEIAERLCAAMDWREPRIPSVLVAKRCGVTPQAVNKWRKEGWIDFKKHLEMLAKVTQVPPMFYLEAERGATKDTRAVWRRLKASSPMTLDQTLCQIAGNWVGQPIAAL